MSQSVDPAKLEGVPAAKPPPGVVPNYVDPQSSGPRLIAVGCILVALMLLFVATRIYTKAKIVKKFSPDDSVTAGRFGTHMWDLTVGDISSDAFLWSGFFINWTTAVIWPFVKLSFFLLYIQIFRPMKWLRYCSYAGALVNVLFYVSILVATLVFTAPAPGQTILEAVQSPRQSKARSMSLYVAAGSFILDVYILVLPIAGVSKLQLPTRRKLGVMAIFFTGFTACIASALSIYYKVQLNEDLSDLSYKTADVIILW
ncbi:MAG: hypothetical protein Q9184_001482 [Pyrenodesmia sp. 2 TL-2023]